MHSEDLQSIFGKLSPDQSVADQLETIDLSYLMQEAGEAIVYVDQGYIVKFCNSVYLQNVRRSKSEVIGKTPFEYFPNFDRSIFYETIEKCRLSRKPTSKIGYSTVLDRWLMVRVFPAGSGMMMLANDASESVVRQVQLAQKAVKDNLTGLRNKIGLLQDAESMLSTGEQFGIALIGLDRFRALNDLLGYAAGDMGLMELSSRMQTSTVNGETLYRLNGDEFAFLTRRDPEHGKQRVQALLDIASAPMNIHGHTFKLGATAGYVEAIGDDADTQRILKRAALALKHEKKQARGTVVTYEQGLEAASELRGQLEGELRKAIDSRELHLYLQPKGSLSDGNLVGAEALIRWPHPKRGMIAPAEFLPLAQECGIMRSIDHFVLSQALDQVKELLGRGMAVPVSINLSMESLTDVCFLERVGEALHRAQVPPNLLEVEIPEGALMHNVEGARKVLEGLDEMGVKISIDDFGTGYSSFSYLARFPVHVLKVDRSFVMDMHENAANQKIVKSIVRLAHSLQIQVTAEGAETDKVIDMLAKLRCDTVQGYGYGRPMPMSQFVDFAHGRKKKRMSAYTV